MSKVDLSQVSTLLRPVSSEVFNGKGKLCLSTNYLHKLNSAFEENISESEDVNSSFHIVQTSNAKTNLLRDIQFLLDLVQRTVTLKVTSDVVNEFPSVNLVRFKNIKNLEIDKIDIKTVLGIQKLRSQVHNLTCSHSLQCISDILDKCGGDDSQRYNWSELKTANFSHNNVTQLDSSFECTPWLHTLDLSHNQLSDIEFLYNLPNLKHLNVSYNKLEKVPKFKGQICSRLQILILSNNFIEDLTGLYALTNMYQLDLSQNCLIDHQTLLSVSQFSSLQWLNLQGNPLSFHPVHRKTTCKYLNKNTRALDFVLDNIALTKAEKCLTGYLYPIARIASLSFSNSSDESGHNSLQEKPKKIRTVTIEDENVAQEKDTPILTPMTSTQHLQIKKQVEQLRQEYGESWLYRDSGLLVQDVLGLEKSSILSSTPLESALDSLYLEIDHISVTKLNTKTNSSNFETATSTLKAASEEEIFETANDDHNIFSNTVDSRDDLSDISDGEDICAGGEEGIYLALTKGEADQEIFVVVTDTHISERDVTTSKEKARWHINTVVSCVILEENKNTVKLDFDTVRRDRKQRVYELEEAESFYNSITEKVANLKSKIEDKKVTYQCMKCSELFSMDDSNKGGDVPSLTCPKCNSNLVIESV